MKTQTKTTKKTLLLTKYLLYIASILRVGLFLTLYTMFDNIIYKVQLYTGITLSSTLQYNIDWYDLFLTFIILVVIFMIYSSCIISFIYKNKYFDFGIFKAMMFKYFINIIIFFIGLFSLRENHNVLNYSILGIVLFLLITFNMYFKPLYKVIDKDFKNAVKLVYKTNKQFKFIYIYKRINLLYVSLNLILLGTPYFITYINNHLSQNKTKL